MERTVANVQKWMRSWWSLAALALIAGVGPAAAQVSPSFYDYVRSDLDWYTLETEHFDVHFHADAEGTGSSRTAQIVARIAEDVYAPITELYEHEPNSKVSILLKDYEDYSNGAAYFFDNKIEIWAPALNTPLRGDHNWLRNVIAHEFTHIVQVQKAMKARRQLPFLYFQFLDYEEVRRPDVLYGYPNVLVTYPVPTLNNPAWLAEGTAQYQRTDLTYDRWDTHRDMLLRTRVLAGEQLTLAEMGGFYSHTSLMREGVYNHGYAFTRYLANTYGEGVLRDVSASLGKWRNWNVERALGEATGTDGRSVYEQWMTTLTDAYRTQTASVRAAEVAGRLVEEEGFNNFYPRFSPAGDRLAYVSNKGEDFSRTSLYVRDLATGEVAVHDLEAGFGTQRVHTCAFGHKVQSRVGGALAWRPDGDAVIYAKTKDTPEGALYSDLYVFDLTTDTETRLTTEVRAADPAVSPNGEQIAFVRQDDGTTNLYVLALADSSLTPVTQFGRGEQVTDPTWDPSGAVLYFGRSGLAPGRDLYRVVRGADGRFGEPEPVLASPADERTPAVGPEGRYLYYASDATGIFNLYRLPLAGGAPEQLTNVLGGAFMPSVRADGAVAYAHYQWDGYKIALLDAAAAVRREAAGIAYEAPAVLRKQAASAQPAPTPVVTLNRYDDTDVGPLPSDAIAQIRGGDAITIADLGIDETSGGTPSDLAELPVEPYEGLFTSFSFYPVLRLDRYVSRTRNRLDAQLGRRGMGETLLRNTKVGVYASSREMLEGMTLFGGLLVGPASAEASSLGDFFSPSRLLDLERDAFLQFEYKRGLGLIDKRWAPQWSIELYNIRRNVENGLSLEEFPCTACFPDTTLADLSYSLWEANLFARSKINRATLLELGYRYSPYRVTTERFFSREQDAFIPASSSRYYIGQAAMANLYVELLRPHRDADVVPDGLKLQLSYEYEPGRLLDRFDVEDGVLVPRYDGFRNHRLMMDARFGTVLPGRPLGASHGLGVRLRGSTILGGEVDDFFNDYLGGLIGVRGYPFYALGGNETAWVQASYTFPILPRVHRQLAFLYLDKIYGRVYGDAAAAWSGAWPGLDEVRKDIGAELRFGLGSFYLLPTAVFVSATYGLDAFDFQLDDAFVAADGQSFVRYGRDWQWHVGVLFGFDL